MAAGNAEGGRTVEARAHALLDLSDTLARATPDAARVLDETARLACQIVGDLAVVVLLSEDGERFEPAAVSHSRADVRAAVEEMLAGADLAVERWPLAGAPIATGEPLLIADVRSSALRAIVNPAVVPHLDRLPVSAAMFVPLRSRGRTIGILGLARDSGGSPYGAEDERVAASLADRAALSIDNARLIGDLRRQNELSQAIIDAHGRLAEGVAIADLEAERFLWVNDALCRMLGRTAEELLGARSFLGLAEPDDAARLDGLRRTWLAGGPQTEHVAARARRADGALVDLTISVKAIDPADPRRVVALLRDVTDQRRAEERLRFQALLLDEVEAVVVAIDTEGHVRHWNRHAERLFGCSPDDALGRHILELAEQAPLEERARLVAGVESAGSFWEAEFTVIGGDGRPVPVYARTAPVHGPDGEAIGHVGVGVDISERKRTENLLREAERRYRSLVERLPAVVYVAEAHGERRWKWASPQVERLSGFPPERFLAEPSLWAERIHPADRDRVLAGDALAEQAGGSRAVEYRIRCADGELVWVRDESVVRPASEGEPAQVEGLIVDVSERRALEARLRHLADHDPLTGLPNRRRIGEEVSQQLRLARRYGGACAVLFVDLDHFKDVNDTLGHEAGDALIGATAEVLRERLRESDTLGRLGGDEFAALLPSTSQEEAVRVAEDLVRALREHEHRPAGAGPLRVTASVGVAGAEGRRTSADELLAAADLAMYEAKRTGRDRVAAFTDELRRRAAERRAVTADAAADQPPSPAASG